MGAALLPPPPIAKGGKTPTAPPGAPVCLTSLPPEMGRPEEEIGRPMPRMEEGRGLLGGRLFVGGGGGGWEEEEEEEGG